MIKSSCKNSVIQNALDGDKVAQCQLGLWYKHGFVVAEKDIRQAYKWLCLSAEQGYRDALRPAAEVIIEHSYSKEPAVGPDDRDKAFFFLKQASDYGDETARYLLGQFYEGFYRKSHDHSDTAWINQNDGACLGDYETHPDQDPNMLLIALAYYDGAGNNTDAAQRYEILREHLLHKEKTELPQIHYTDIKDPGFPGKYEKHVPSIGDILAYTKLPTYDPWSVNPVYVRTLKDSKTQESLVSPMEVFRGKSNYEGNKSVTSKQSQNEDLSKDSEKDMQFSDFAFKTGADGEEYLEIFEGGIAPSPKDDHNFDRGRDKSIDPNKEMIFSDFAFKTGSDGDKYLKIIEGGIAPFTRDDHNFDHGRGKSIDPNKEMTFSDFAFKTGADGEKYVEIFDCDTDNPELDPYTENPIDIGGQHQFSQECQIPPGAAQESLDKLVGLKHVKSQIRTFENRMMYEEKRQESGLKKGDFEAHFLFLGDPGTGKTTVARILGALLRDKGYLSSGHVVEVERSQLIGEFVGWTAPKVKEIFMSALDGVLFIDEAYNLFNNHPDAVGGFEDEAVSTLLKLMEDYRDRVVVVLAGYTEEMQWLIRSNSGLQSRFPFTIEFDPYSAEELSKMFEDICNENDYSLTDDTRHRVTILMQKALDKKGSNFGHGRFVRHAFNRTIDKIANRVASEIDLDSDKDLSVETLCTILPLDIPGLSEIDVVTNSSSPTVENNVIPMTPADDPNRPGEDDD